ncbi:(21S)-21-acetoxyl-apo-melianone synthase SDR-like [Silene latifolia]|uniref:(21S)-21-acetoxyl-apo-melianone synthase SDR-like n=1 Tax=Silene latifolia TaxID=37657 RepID=UPI003D7897F5
MQSNYTSTKSKHIISIALFLQLPSVSSINWIKMNSSSALTTEKRLKDKVAIITGGASGIGASTAKLFWENGAKVVIADIQDDLGQQIVNNLNNHNIVYFKCDISNEQNVSDLIDYTISKYGTLDIMYNNAGVRDVSLGSILDSTEEGLDRVIRTNLYGSFYGAKHASRVMIPKKRGCILFTSSVCTSIAGIATHPYTMSKYGVLGLVKNLSAELKEFGIRVNCISPSGVFTGMSKKLEGVRGVLRADDVAQAALFLASDDAKFVNGHNLITDGGSSVTSSSMRVAFTSK